MSLFVPEEEEHPALCYVTDIQDQAELDDPVEWEVPVAMNPVPVPDGDQEGEEVSLALLQFPGRPATRPYNIATDTLPVGARYKAGSQAIEVEIPMNTGRFYDATRASAWNEVQTQTLGGPFVETEGYYIGIMDEGIMKLMPLLKSTQMRLTFNHIDSQKDAEKSVLREEMRADNPTKSKEVLVQMSVKSALDQQPRLGGCLAATKQFDEEVWQDMEWVDESLEQSETVRRVVVRGNDLSTVVTSSMTPDGYAEMLFAAADALP